MVSKKNTDFVPLGPALPLEGKHEIPANAGNELMAEVIQFKRRLAEEGIDIKKVRVDVESAQIFLVTEKEGILTPKDVVFISWICDIDFAAYAKDGTEIDLKEYVEDFKKVKFTKLEDETQVLDEKSVEVIQREIADRRDIIEYSKHTFHKDGYRYLGIQAVSRKEWHLEIAEAESIQQLSANGQMRLVMVFEYPLNSTASSSLGLLN